MSRPNHTQPPGSVYPDQDHTGDSRLTEQPNPRTTAIDRADTAGILELLFAEDGTVASAVAREAEHIGRLVDLVYDRLRAGGRLFYVGAGTSGRLGVLDAAECPPTFGTPPGLVGGIIAGGYDALVRSQEGAEDDREAGRSAIREVGVGPRDFVLGIAASGSTPYVLSAVTAAASLGAGTGILSCAPPAEELVGRVDVLITPITGPEAVTGSTRLKAGTATKLVLNAVTTAVMIRLGKVYGNRMVDLQARSEKLADRSLRILADVAGVDRAVGTDLLIKSGASVKTALMMHVTGSDRNLAERRLDAVGGYLGAALERFPEGAPVRFYDIYDPAEDSDERVLEVFASGPARLRAAVADRTRAGEPRGGARHPWPPDRHLRHLIACEIGMIQPRLEALREAGAGVQPAFADWAEPDDRLEPAGSGEALDEFDRRRAATVDMIRSGGPDLLNALGCYCEETFSVRQFVQAMSQHDRAHAIRITEWIHPSIVSGA